MNTAEELSPFVSAVKPLPDNVVPFRKPEPVRELTFNELLLSFHAGSPYAAWLRPNPEAISELLKTQPDYQFIWKCGTCGHIPPKASMMMITPQISMCDACYTTLNKLSMYSTTQTQFQY